MIRPLRGALLAIISPRLLLKIDFTASQREDQRNMIEGIPAPWFDQFQRRAAANAFKDIIFSDAYGEFGLEKHRRAGYRVRQHAMPRIEEKAKNRNTCRMFEIAVRFRGHPMRSTKMAL